MKKHVSEFKDVNTKTKLIAASISFAILLIMIICIYFFWIKALEPNENAEVKFLSLTDSKVTNVYKYIDVFSDKYNPEIEAVYENFINEFYSFDKKTPADFSDELKMYVGVTSLFDYKTIEYKTDDDGNEYSEISTVDIKRGAEKVFGSNLEYTIKPFDSGTCHFGEFFEVEKSLMYKAVRDQSNCQEKNSQFITELITAQEDGDKLILEIQTGFVNIEDGVAVLYTNPDKNGRVSNNIDKYFVAGSYTTALSTYKNNLNLYTVIFEYTGTEYRFSSITRTR